MIRNLLTALLLFGLLSCDGAERKTQPGMCAKEEMAADGIVRLSKIEVWPQFVDEMLVCVAGKGWYQEEGKPAVQMLPGDVIHIPANVKHWHGAAADSWFAHLAFEVPGENTSNEWLEPVTDEEYNRLGK